VSINDISKRIWLH